MSIFNPDRPMARIFLPRMTGESELRLRLLPSLPQLDTRPNEEGDKIVPNERLRMGSELP